MKIRLFIQIGIALAIGVSPLQNAAAQSAIQQLGGQNLQDGFDNLHKNWGTLQQQRGAVLGTSANVPAAPGGSAPQQQSAVQIGTMAGNLLGNMFAQPKGGIATGSAQRQSQIAAQQLNNSGVYLLKQKNYAGAVNEFQKALAKTPGDQTIQNNLKLAQQKLNDAGTAAQTRDALGQLLGAPPADSAISTPPSSGYSLNPANNDSANASVQPADAQQAANAIDQALGQNQNTPAQQSNSHLLDNVGNPDFDGNAGGNGAITGSGGSSPAQFGSDTVASQNQKTDAGQTTVAMDQALGQSSGDSKSAGANSSDSSASAQSGQQVVQMGVPPDKAGLTPIAGGSASPGTDTKAGDQLVSAAASGQNSGKNFDSGGQSAGSLNMPGSATTNGTTQTDADFQKQTQLELSENGRDAVADKLPSLTVGNTIPKEWLDRFKNKGLRNWAATIVCGRELLDYDRYGIAAGNTLVIIPEVFNSPKLTDSQRINLLAFELGKVFYIKNFPRGDAFDYLDANKKTYLHVSPVTLWPKEEENYTLGDTDASSGFGYIFRVELLGIPTDGTAWDNVHKNFYNKVNPILQKGNFLVNP